MNTKQQMILEDITRNLEDLYEECANDPKFHDFIVSENTKRGVIPMSLDEMASEFREMSATKSEDELTDWAKRLRKALQWHQDNDKNGDYMTLWDEFMTHEAGICQVYSVCDNAFKAILDEHLSDNDPQRLEIEAMREYIQPQNSKEEQ